MTTPALGPEIFTRGFRFNPTPHEAVSYYLPRLTSGEPLHEVVRSVIHHADVYACEPAELACRFRPMPKTGDRFFFAPCKNQNQKAVRAAAASPSSWAVQTTAGIHEGNGAKVGVLRKLRYKKRGVLTDWLMDECSSCGGGGDMQQQQFVFCKVYVSPRAAPTSTAHQESAAFFALTQLPLATPAPATVITHRVIKRTTAPPPPQAAMPPRAKRTAPLPPQAAMPPCAKRMRGPVVQPAPQAPIRSPLTAVRKLYFAPPQPSPAPVQAPAPPVVTRPVVEPRRSPMPAPPRPSLARPMQQVPLPTPPVVQASRHMPRQAPASTLCQPQVSVPATTPDPPPSNQFSAAAPVLQDDDDDLVKALEEAMSTAEAEDQTMVPALQDEDDDDWDDLDKALGLEE